MAFQSVPETAQITVVFTTNGQNMVNTFYARKTGGYAALDIQDLATAVDDWVLVHLRPILGSETMYVRTEVRGLENEEDFFSESANGSGLGGVTSASVPNQVCLAMKRVSGLTGRSARGRVYVPIYEAVLSTNENAVLTSFADDLRDVLDLLRGLILVIEWVEVIVSRWNEGVKRTSGITFPVTGYTYTDTTVDTQRGRLH